MSVSVEECKEFTEKSYSILGNMTIQEIDEMVEEIEYYSCGVIFTITKELVDAYRDDNIKEYCEKEALK